MISVADDRIPVTILTGFLGSGKTTVLNRFLASGHASGCALIINELGSIGVDDVLLRSIDQRTIELTTGCVCCQSLGDLPRTLLDLFVRSNLGDIPSVQSVVLETTGVANVSPLVSVIEQHPPIATHFSLQRVVACVDATQALAQQHVHPEWREQLRSSDLAVITKHDLVNDTQFSAVQQAIREANAYIEMLDGMQTDAVSSAILRASSAMRTTNVPDAAAPSHVANLTVINLVGTSIEWAAFVRWVDAVLSLAGDSLVRAKGLIDAGGQGPVSFQCVGGVVYPPVMMSSWFESPRRTVVVVVLREPGALVEQNVRGLFAELSHG